MTIGLTIDLRGRFNMRYPQERKYLDESAAVFADYQSNPRFKTVDLYRFFSTSRIELQASGLAMLDKFTSAKTRPRLRLIPL